MEITKYGETNLILDLVFDRDNNSVEVVKKAEQGKIDLSIPEVSFYEVYGAVHRTYKSRITKANSIRALANEIGRSAIYYEVAESLKNSAAKVEESAKQSLEVVDRILDRLQKVVITLEFDAEDHTKAFLFSLDGRYDLDLPDAAIYTSILKDARDCNNAKKIFFTKNSKDFDKPKIKDDLNKLGVELIFSSGECIKLIKQGY